MSNWFAKICKECGKNRYHRPKRGCCKVCERTRDLEVPHTVWDDQDGRCAGCKTSLEENGLSAHKGRLVCPACKATIIASEGNVPRLAMLVDLLRRVGK